MSASVPAAPAWSPSSRAAPPERLRLRLRVRGAGAWSASASVPASVPVASVLSVALGVLGALGGRGGRPAPARGGGDRVGRLEQRCDRAGCGAAAGLGGCLVGGLVGLDGRRRVGDGGLLRRALGGRLLRGGLLGRRLLRGRLLGRLLRRSRALAGLGRLRASARRTSRRAARAARRRPGPRSSWRRGCRSSWPAPSGWCASSRRGRPGCRGRRPRSPGLSRWWCCRCRRACALLGSRDADGSASARERCQSPGRVDRPGAKPADGARHVCVSTVPSIGDTLRVSVGRAATGTVRGHRRRTGRCCHQRLTPCRG